MRELIAARRQQRNAASKRSTLRERGAVLTYVDAVRRSAPASHNNNNSSSKGNNNKQWVSERWRNPNMVTL